MTDLTSIFKSYPYKTELHAHTSPVSECGHVSPSETVSLYRRIRCDTLTITNHLNPLWSEGDPKERAKEYLADYDEAVSAAEGTELTVALGVEIRFPENNNDYLVYGVCPDDIEHFIRLIPYGIETFYKEVKTNQNVILQAHPFRRDMVLAPLSAIDGIESMNMHPGQNSAVGLATQYAKEHELLVSGGSDFHKDYHCGVCLTRTKEKMRDSYDIAALIKSRDLLFDLSGHIVIPYLYS